VKACTKVDENLPSFNAELSESLKNAPNIKDGYNREIILKQVSAKQGAMRIVMKVALMKTKVKALTKVDQNFNRTHFNAELIKYLNNAPNIKDGYIWK